MPRCSPEPGGDRGRMEESGTDRLSGLRAALLGAADHALLVRLIHRIQQGWNRSSLGGDHCDAATNICWLSMMAETRKTGHTLNFPCGDQVADSPNRSMPVATGQVTCATSCFSNLAGVPSPKLWCIPSTTLAPRVSTALAIPLVIIPVELSVWSPDQE